MIQEISVGPFLEISNTFKQWVSNPGQVKFNSEIQSLEIIDQYGNSTRLPTQFPTIQLSPEAVKAIQWVIDRMQAEEKYQSLALQHPAIQDELNTLRESKARLDVLVNLIKNHEQSNS